MNETLQTMIAEMTLDLYQRLAKATETGKWPDGIALSSRQREHCLQLVLLWQAKHNHRPQHMTLAPGGELVVKSPSALKKELGIQDNITRISLDD